MLRFRLETAEGKELAITGRLLTVISALQADSAVRATRIASGLSVKVQTERSQHANKRLASQLIASELTDLAKAAESKTKADRRMQHHQTERGNAVRVFTGSGFTEQVRQ